MKLTEEQIKIVEENYDDFIKRFIRTRRLKADEVHGIISESLMKAARGYKEGSASLYTYFYSIARRDVARYYSRKNAKKKDKNGYDVTFVNYIEESDLDLSGDGMAIDDYSSLLLENFSKEDRLLCGYLLEGYTQTEIAEITGVNRQSVVRDIYKLRDMVGESM